jgi:replicative DNA helicase
LILIAQLNRECEKQNRPPMISDLRESGALEQDADMILFPHSPKPEDPKLFSQPRPAQIIVAKNRGGMIGTADEQWVPELMTFRELTNDGYYEPEETK